MWIFFLILWDIKALSALFRLESHNTVLTLLIREINKDGLDSVCVIDGAEIYNPVIFFVIAWVQIVEDNEIT